MESTGTEVARSAEIVAPPRRRVTRSRIGVVLLLLGLVVAFLPGLLAGDEFLGASNLMSQSVLVTGTNGGRVRIVGPTYNPEGLRAAIAECRKRFGGQNSVSWLTTTVALPEDALVLRESDGTARIVRRPASGAAASQELTPLRRAVDGPAYDITPASRPAVTVTSTVLLRTDSLVRLVQQEAGWAAAVAGLAIAPVLFLWWRRCGVSFGRMIGVATCIASAAAVCALVLVLSPDAPVDWTVWWTVPLGALLMAAAFVVAPAPRRSLDD